MVTDEKLGALAAREGRSGPRKRDILCSSHTFALLVHCDSTILSHVSPIFLGSLNALLGKSEA